MTVKLKRYIFKKIGGSIVPMRKGLELATKSQSELAHKILTKSKKFSFPAFNKLGSGVDFTAYRGGDDVIKVTKTWGRKLTRGTSNKWFTKQWPELGDKLAVNKALSDNLPNYGIPTTETKIIRLDRSKRGILQRYVEQGGDSLYHKNSSHYVQKESEKLLKDTGLHIDAHAGNIRSGELIDSGGNLLKSKIKQVRHSDQAKEMLGVDGWFGTKVKDHVNKAEVLTHQAAVNGQSAGLLRKLKSLKKSGWRFVSKGADEARLVNPVPRKNSIPKENIRFIRRHGRIIPIRVKK